jgi:uncharacterized phage-associated protein
MRGFNYKKSVQVLNYLASKSDQPFNKMKAIKLVWLADRLHLRKYGRTITGDTYFAMKLGPVGSNTRDILETSSFLSDETLEYSTQYIDVIDKYNYTSKQHPNFEVFSQTDTEAITEIFDAYGNYGHYELSQISHSFPEWKRWKSALDNKNGSSFLIQFEDFFQDHTNKKTPFSDNDEALRLIKKLYLKADESLNNASNQSSI